MTNEQKKNFTRRLSQCNPGEMIVIIYDILFVYMEDVALAYENDRTEMKTGIRKAQRVLEELMNSLDFSYELSNNLYSLYVFCKNELSRTLYQGNLEGLLEAEKILKRLYGAFCQAAIQDKSEPIMGNTQQVYAGMTYGRSSLNESYMENNARGFFA